MFRELFGNPKSKGTVAPPVKLAAAAHHSDSILGADTHFEGTLKSAGNVRVDGTFTGNISTQGNVVIGEQGEIEGDLSSETVAVAGIMRGDVTARKVSILRTGRVWGNLRLETLMTEEGSFIQGQVTMEESVDLSSIDVRLPDETRSIDIEKEKADVPIEKEKL